MEDKPTESLKRYIQGSEMTQPTLAQLASEEWHTKERERLKKVCIDSILWSKENLSEERFESLKEAWSEYLVQEGFTINGQTGVWKFHPHESIEKVLEKTYHKTPDESRFSDLQQQIDNIIETLEEMHKDMQNMNGNFETVEEQVSVLEDFDEKIKTMLDNLKTVL